MPGREFFSGRFFVGRFVGQGGTHVRVDARRPTAPKPAWSTPARCARSSARPRRRCSSPKATSIRAPRSARRASPARRPATSIRAIPTRPLSMFEQRMAALEGAEAARSTATGMAAVTTALMGLVQAGDHVVAAKALFGSCRWVIEEWLPRFGVTSTLVDGTDLDRLEEGGAARTPRRSSWKRRPIRRWRSSTSPRSPRSRTTPAPSWWSTMCSPRRSTRARSRSAPTAWSIRRPSTSTARAACSAASSWRRKNSSWITCTRSSARPDRRCRRSTPGCC